MNFKQASVIIGLSTVVFGTSAVQAAAVTITDITLFNSQDPGIIWITSSPSSHWILGVSNQPHGPLLNAPNASVAGIPQGNYWLFADPANLGPIPELDVTLSDGSSLSALFQVVGNNGVAQSWSRLSGSTQLSLGWATGTADLVGTYGGIRPDGINDFYMTATIGVAPVPVPAAVWLVGSGLLGLIGIAKRVSSEGSMGSDSIDSVI